MKDLLNSIVTKRNAELEEIKARLEALEKINETSEDETELKAASDEIDALQAKKAELEEELEKVNAQLAELDKPADPEPQPQRKLNFMKKEERGNNMNKEELELRANKFKETGSMSVETRALLVSSGKIATPTEVEGINELDNTVPSLIDMADVDNCEGMGSLKVAYEFTATEAGETTEGAAYAEGDTVVDFVEIKPSKVTTISYISEEVVKQSPLDYQGKVKKNALLALRRKVNELAIAKVKASDLNTKVTLPALNENSIRTIVLSYGSEDGVVGNAILALNKTTLANLGKVRGTNEKKAVYEIAPDAGNPNTGTIKEGGTIVRYTINSKLADNELVYGQAKKLKIALFGNYEIKVSEDFKFDTGMLAIRGSVQMGADVVYKDGFVVATVGAAA